MNKRVFLRNYEGEKTAVVIPDFENVTRMRVEIITGDEILFVQHSNQQITKYDSAEDRMVDFFDEWYELPKELIDEFSAHEGRPHECSEHIRKLKWIDTWWMKNTNE